MPRTLLAFALLSFGCAADSDSPPLAEAPSARDALPEAAVPAAGERTRIVFVGDSLAAGYGLAEEQAFPALVAAELRRRRWEVEVVNGGVSGDTTAGGRSRLGWLLRQEPEIVVLELGANDGLRGVPVESIRDNLRDMIERSRRAGARVLLLGMRMPPNYGDEYTRRFAAVYPDLAEELDVAFMPFLLAGVAGRTELNLADGIHPNAAGHRRVAQEVVPYLEELLEELAAEEAA